MVETGNGIACLPAYLAAKFKDLVQILPEIKTPCVRFYFIYPRKLKESVRIVKLWEFLQKEVEKDNKNLKEHVP